MIIFIIALIVIVTILYAAYNKKAHVTQPDAQTEKQILQQHVLFYQRLTDEEKTRFEETLQKFLQKVGITGVKSNVEDTDRVFVAAAAIIPIFFFEGDKVDGDTDGFPRALLPHKYVLPWLKRIHQEIQQIKSGGSDINPYAATNEAEFLAIAAEYFFEQPQLMEQKHPALYDLLKQVFKTSTSN